MTKLNLENFLPYRLNRIASLVSKEFRTVYGPDYDLTIPEWRVLATLGQFEHMSAREIGAHSAMHKTKVSRAVHALEDRRWLRREGNEHDRREEILSLTVAGRRYYDSIIPRAVAFEQRLLDALGKDAEQLLLVLSRLEGSFSLSAGDS
ncbi:MULTISPECIES: MarR family winged helix-turn-helix transcriptional regulator [Rhizobium/Agrobacterium group]|uniref:MarR family winged helix-turn-helix transcriptional regulator n=1 Tax=Rhizobium/Agrobacterium group TaxID=227290 RepID=UPI001ADB4A14|nr:MULTISPECIES: MarR family winged helix-turn-helix transcriptional regulator [Rhizobium/Agrobacterium group]MBO9112680.1 winged helix-turn-helix transcriptional regulator [Agrobacterium sp. S2/73]QXZ76170.1 winged helix-turn-helix transcriptional regulator [Agrobacterium sp. S7/73]QYA17281.1 winged helix-turn-helix transcriptional regulator [Rhizobium sp. AB2/73]UEQ85602.1 winged helix-turn-helix transcriptional regulator [Rhizobium sp. AB2/73]